MTKRPTHRSGYTLLEVLLVLLITGVLVAAVAAALNIHLRAVEAGRAEVEQAQLARALLRHIADDLRAAVPIIVDSSGVMPASTSAASIGSASGSGGGTGTGTSSGSGSGSSSGSSGAGGTSGGSGSSGVTNITGSTGTTSAATAAVAGGPSGSGSSSGASSGSSTGSSSRSSGGSTSASKSSSGSSSSGTSGGSTAGMSSGGSSTGSGSAGSSSSSSSPAAANTTTDAASSDATISPLGVYGTQYDLQIDVSRLPRTDRIDSLTGTIAPSDPSAPADPPSDVKTVSYYISTTAAAIDPAAVSMMGGLVRRQQDRSVVNYSTLFGGTADPGMAEKVLAPEAVALEFRYFDGTEWLTSWDSSDRKAVPVAVEIYLTLRAVQPEIGGVSTLLLASPGLPQEQTYRLVVHLPAGEPSTAGAAELEAAAAESTEATP